MEIAYAQKRMLQGTVVQVSDMVNGPLVKHLKSKTREIVSINHQLFDIFLMYQENLNNNKQ